MFKNTHNDIPASHRELFGIKDKTEEMHDEEYAEAESSSDSLADKDTFRDHHGISNQPRRQSTRRRPSVRFTPY